MNLTILRLAAHALLGQRRVYLLVLLPVLLVALSVAIRVYAGPNEGTPVVEVLGYGLALPLTALLSASTVLGPEIDDGSVVYLLARPVDRRVVALSKYVAAVVSTWVFAALPLLVCSLISDSSDATQAIGWGLAGVTSGTAYTALFLALCTLTRHAVVVGLLIVLFWQGLLGNFLDGIRWVNATAWGREVGASISDAIIGADIPLWYAVAAVLVLTVGCVWFAGERLRSFSITADT